MAYKHNKTWRQKNPEKRHEGKKKNYNKTSWAPNAKQLWSAVDVSIIQGRRKTDYEISQEIGRSVQSIQQKRSRLKLY